MQRLSNCATAIQCCGYFGDNIPVRLKKQIQSSSLSDLLSILFYPGNGKSDILQIHQELNSGQFKGSRYRAVQELAINPSIGFIRKYLSEKVSG